MGSFRWFATSSSCGKTQRFKRDELFCGHLCHAAEWSMRKFALRPFFKISHGRLFSIKWRFTIRKIKTPIGPSLLYYSRPVFKLPNQFYSNPYRLARDIFHIVLLFWPTQTEIGFKSALLCLPWKKPVFCENIVILWKCALCQN